VALIEPTDLFPPITPLTCQFTSVTGGPVTVALNCCVLPAGTLADVGEMVILADCEPPPLDEVPPQPANRSEPSRLRNIRKCLPGTRKPHLRFRQRGIRQVEEVWHSHPWLSKVVSPGVYGLYRSAVQENLSESLTMDGMIGSRAGRPIYQHCPVCPRWQDDPPFESYVDGRSIGVGLSKYSHLESSTSPRVQTVALRALAPASRVRRML
jgi:hypothetical protein